MIKDYHDKEPLYNTCMYIYIYLWNIMEDIHHLYSIAIWIWYPIETYINHKEPHISPYIPWLYPHMDHVWSNPQQKGKHRGTSCPWSSWHHLQLLHPWAPLGLALGVSVRHINPGYLSKKIQMNSTSMYLT